MKSFARRQFEGIGVASLDCAGHAFAPHFHDEFVLSVNTVGAERISLERTSFEAGACDITLYNPEQVQSSHAIGGGEWRFLSLYVDPRFLRSAFDLSPEIAFDRPLLRHDGAAARMAAAIQFGLDPDAPAGAALERLIQVLDELLALAASRRPIASQHIPSALARVAERLADGAAMPTLTQLSQEAGLTPVQLVRHFARAYGLPPFAWAANRRVNEACSRLQRGESIAHVAADLGFADQAHLTRRFRAVYGVPPGRWRKG